jgi:signal transduction histidine kinase/ActR/RegA family two-component response regulator
VFYYLWAVFLCIARNSAIGSSILLFIIKTRYAVATSNNQTQQKEWQTDAISIGSSLIHAEQLRLLYGSTPLVVFATVLNAALLVIVLWNVSDRTSLLIWLGTITILMLWRAWNGFTFKRASPDSKNNTSWSNKFNVGVILTGISWASVSIFLFPDNSVAHQVFIVFVLGGMTAGAVGTLSFQRLPIISYLILLLLPIIVRMALTGTQMGIIMGIMLTLYLFILLNSSRNFYETTRQNIALHYEAKQREEEMKKAVAEAESANQAKSQFLARMSHELRTPLNAILGFAQIMESSGDGSTIAEHHDNISTIIHSGWHLLRIINDVLNLSSIEANKIDLYVNNVSVNECILDCIEILLPLSQERDIALNYSDSTCEGLLVRADPFRLKQVLLNLIANAVKFNRDGGSVSVHCQAIQSGRIRIAVSDTGHGFQEKDIPSLFQAFSRLPERAYSVQGAGIGLAISKQLTELMDGTIGVESVLGKGSTFWIELPESSELTQAKAKRPANHDEKSVENTGQFTLLYIEDNPSHIQLVETIVKDMPGIRLLAAPTPTLGLELAKAHQPDVIALDICLPGMDGFEVLEQLRVNETTRVIPVIAVSASAMPEDIEKGLRTGFRRYFTKPINIIEFRKAVNELLEDSVI